MMSMRYAGGTAAISDALCGALLNYATVLFRVGEKGIAEFPAVTDEGSVRQVTLLLGPGSEMWFTEIDPISAVVDDTAAVSLLTIKADLLSGRSTFREVESAELDPDGGHLDLDYL